MHHLSSLHGRTSSQRKSSGKNGETYDFGWSRAWMNGYWIGASLFLGLAVLVIVLNPALWILAGLFLLISLNFFLGNFAMRTSRKTIVLPRTDLFPAGSALILDAGCGAGRTTISVGEALKKVRIVSLDLFDASYIQGGGKTLIERNLKIAGLTERVEVVQGDVTRLQFEDNHFDGAVSSFMIDHLGDKKLAALKEVNRTLKPGGRFLLIVLVPNVFTFAAASLMFLMLTSRQGWRELFRQSGFRLLAEGSAGVGGFFWLEKVAG